LPDSPFLGLLSLRKARSILADAFESGDRQPHVQTALAEIDRGLVLLGVANTELKQLMGLFAQAPIAITVLRGTDFVIELVNPEVCRIWGRREEDLLRKPFFQALPEAADQGLEALLEGVLSTGVPYVGKELPVQLARAESGGLETVYFDFVYQPVTDLDGRVGSILVVANDVTQSVLARRQVEAERAKLHSLFMQTPGPICILEGPRLIFILANAAWRALVGGRDVVGRPFLDALPELRGQHFEVRMNEVMSTGEPFIGNEMPITLDRSGDGHRTEVLVNFISAPMRNAEGAVTGVLVSASDVTGQVRSRQRVEALAAELRVSEERLRRVVEASETGTWEVDLSSGSVTGDSRAYVLNGSEKGVIVSLDASLASIHPEDRERVADLVSAAVAGENNGQYTAEYRTVARGDGATRWIEARGQATFDAEGKAVRLSGTIVDIAARKRAQEFERQLIGIVSHDLRNPLNTILLGAVGLLRRESLDAPGTKGLVRIRNAAERAARMIHDLLDFTQARLGGGIHIERRTIDMHLLAKEVLEEVQASYPAREVELVCEGDGRGEWDRDRLAQVIQNLVTNALKYSPQASSVQVGTRGEDEWICLSVQNAGAPIPPDRIGRLFEPLQRATSVGSNADRSVGLGLYIVKQIVNAHGGTVDVISNAAESTLFTVKLPRMPLAQREAHR
jgi:PAS domain S-box-containing protein